MKRYYLLFLIIVTPYIKLSAQRPNEIDSVHINPEFLKAIQEGTLINTEPAGQQTLHMPSNLPILKDFSEYLKPDMAERKLNYEFLPSAVFSLYGPDTVIGIKINKGVYTFKKQLIINNQIALKGTSFNVSAGSQNLFLEEVKDGQKRGSIGVSVGAKFDAEGALRYIFWKSERDKRRNKKRDFTRKHYNSYP